MASSRRIGSRTNGMSRLKNWLNTPDGRQGWASYFLDSGYRVYLTDQPQRGRSAWLEGDGSLGLRSVKYVQEFYIAVQNFNLWPQATLHNQWPGTGLAGDLIFDAFYKSQVQFQANPTVSEINNRAAGVTLLDRIGPAIIITHSQAGPYGWGIGDARPALVKGIVAIEPQGPPFVDQIIGSAFARPYGITNLPIAYDPPVTDPATDLPQQSIPPAENNLSSCILQKNPPKKLANLSKIPILLITSEASYHAVYDYCTFNYLKQAGVDVKWLNLTAFGIRGNGHFLFMEKNNLVIAAQVKDWVQKVNSTGGEVPLG